MNIIQKIRRNRWINSERRKITNQVNVTTEPKVIIGAGTTNYTGWIKSDYPFFDITSNKQWTFIFKKNKPTNILCEHVLEHFTENENELILNLVYKNLKSGGSIRIAVPDKNHPNHEYIKHVKPGGIGSGADDHKSFWDYKSYKQLLEKIGFKVKLLEYCDEERNIVTSKYGLDNGVVMRSLSYGHKSEIENYSSLIIDAVK